MVVKKDHSREVFDRQKLLNGMLRACEKAPPSATSSWTTLSAGSSSCCSTPMTAKSLPSISAIWLCRSSSRWMMSPIVRFASVYRQFSDVNTFYGRIEGHAGQPIKNCRKMILLYLLQLATGPVRL